MITITHYWVVNGTKSDVTPYSKTLKNKRELNKEREILEEELNCVVTDMFGKKQRKANIFFRYKEN